MRKKIVSGIMLALMAVLILSVQSPVRAQKTEVKIGWSMPMTGPVAPTAFCHHMYYWMVIDDFNSIYGGLYVPEEGKRLPIVKVPKDDEYDESNMLLNYQTLKDIENVDLFFAPWSTEHVSRAYYDFFEPNQIPTVALTAGSNTLSNYLRTHTPWMVMTLGQPWEDAEEMVYGVFSYINSKVAIGLRIDKVGIAYRKDEHGIQHAGAIKNACISIGISVPVYQGYDLPEIVGPPDWAAIVSAFRTEDVDVCIICGYGEAAGFVKECIAQNYNPKLIVTGPAMETSFLVYGRPPDGFGFIPGEVAGIMYYNGFPSCAYQSYPFSVWYQKHRVYSRDFTGGPGGLFPEGYPPFPASAVFYAGPECLLRAAEIAGLTNRAGIRAELENRNFTITMGLGTTPAAWIKFRRGQSPLIAQHGTTTQWQGAIIMDVVWPRAQRSTDFIIYPRFPWSWGDVPDVIRDGIVDGRDLWLVAKDYGWRGPKFDKKTDVHPAPDKTTTFLPGNGLVDGRDLWLVAKSYGSRAAFGGTVSLK